MAPAPAPPSPNLQRVLAGPGSGKTRLLTEAIRKRLDAGVASTALLAVTFTRRAAKEMLLRLSTPALTIPWVGTFHALARRILLELQRLPTPLNLDTLIPEATQALREGAVPAWVRQIQFLAVDEAQDLDAPQVEFLQEFRRHTRNAELLLVGDPDQAIYGFRHASPRYLLEAEQVFQQPCKTLCLADNHRSARQIVEIARAILGPSADPQAPCHRLAPVRPEAHPAVRWIAAKTEQGEAVRIFEEIRTLLALGISPKDIAILVRVRAQMPALQTEAAHWNIPVHLPPLRDQLEDGQDPPAPPAEALQLMTIHQAKGCEFTVVFIAGCQEGIMPYPLAQTPEARYEELRLLYVAVTRAKQLVWFCRHGHPSPFLRPLSRTTATPQPVAPSPKPTVTTSMINWFRRRLRF